MLTEAPLLDRTITLIARFYKGQKHGYEGCEGYRKSTDLLKFTSVIGELKNLGLIDRDRTVFLDLGCADGRVNVLMSYFVKQSIDVEIDQLILDDYERRKNALSSALKNMNLLPPPDNLHLFPGNSLDPKTYEQISDNVGAGFPDAGSRSIAALYGKAVNSEQRRVSRLAS